MKPQGDCRGHLDLSFHPALGDFRVIFWEKKAKQNSKKAQKNLELPDVLGKN